MLEKIFKLKEYGTNVKTEIMAGITTFISMAYILAVNPNILGNVMDKNGVFMAIALASAIATFVMAFYANYPIALSAGMGINAYFAFSVCIGELGGEPDAFSIALTAVLVEGILFIIISFFKLREGIVNGIPANLKYGITAGIGLFIAFMGLQEAGISVKDSSTLVALGDFAAPQVIFAIVGFFIILALAQFKVKGAVLIGILATWVMGIIAQLTGWYQVNPAAGLNSLIPDFSQGVSLGGLENTAFKFNFAWAGSHIIEFIAMVFSFMFVDLFDTVGTVVGVADKANLIDKDGKIPRIGRIFMADAVGTTVGACLGTSTITSYVESGTGVAAGGRTGLTALTTGCMFLISIVLSPIFMTIPGFATAPALLYVGMLMLTSLGKIRFNDDYAGAAAAFMTAIVIPLTYSIANGIMLGILTWVILKILTGKIREIKPIMWILFVLFVLRIISLALGVHGT